MSHFRLVLLVIANAIATVAGFDTWGLRLLYSQSGVGAPTDALALIAGAVLLTAIARGKLDAVAISIGATAALCHQLLMSMHFPIWAGATLTATALLSEVRVEGNLRKNLGQVTLFASVAFGFTLVATFLVYMYVHATLTSLAAATLMSGIIATVPALLLPLFFKTEATEQSLLGNPIAKAEQVASVAAEKVEQVEQSQPGARTQSSAIEDLGVHISSVPVSATKRSSGIR